VDEEASAEAAEVRFAQSQVERYADRTLLGAVMPQDLRPYDISKLRKVFSMVKFKLTHRPCSKIFTIMSITAKPASEITFTLAGRDGAPDTKTNIAAYFKTAYNINLRYPNLVSIRRHLHRIHTNPYLALYLVRSEELRPHGVCCLGAFQRSAS
jgi:hypothetical protein